MVANIARNICPKREGGSEGIADKHRFTQIPVKRKITEIPPRCGVGAGISAGWFDNAETDFSNAVVLHWR